MNEEEIEKQHPEEFFKNLGVDMTEDPDVTAQRAKVLERGPHESTWKRGSEAPTIGRIVHYTTDGRNGLSYPLPAIVTVTRDTHPGDYPDGRKNPLPVPDTEFHVHLTVFTPGGFGTTVAKREEFEKKNQAFFRPPVQDTDFPDSIAINPGSGSYVEWNVPYSEQRLPGTWCWPSRGPRPGGNLRKKDGLE